MKKPAEIEKEREKAIRAWQAKQGYDVLELNQIQSEKSADRLRVLRKCWEHDIDIQGLSFETLEHIVNHKLI